MDSCSFCLESFRSYARHAGDESNLGFIYNNVFLSSQLILNRYRILGWQGIFCCYFFSISAPLIGSAIICLLVLCLMRKQQYFYYFFFLWLFSKYFLFLVFSILIMIYLGMVFFVLSLSLFIETYLISLSLLDLYIT